MNKRIYISSILGIVLSITLFGAMNVGENPIQAFAIQQTTPYLETASDIANIEVSSSTTRAKYLSNTAPQLTEDMPGLTIVPPAGWYEAIASVTPPENANGISGAEVVRFVYPDEMYFMDVIVNWFSDPPPEATFGNFEMTIDARYQESTLQLPTGELVQVMQATATMNGSIFPVIRAAFRYKWGSYSLAIYGQALNEEIQEIFLQTLNSMAPNDETLPEVMVHTRKRLPGPIGIPEPPNPPSLLSIDPSPNQAVAFDRDAAVRYANTYVNVFDNSDDCYLWYNRSILICSTIERDGYWGVDGAHFVNRAMEAGGLPIPGLPDSVAKSSEPLRDWLLNHGGQEISDPNDLEPGDVIFFGTNGCWGWEGVVVDQNGPGPRVHLHSRISGGITIDWPYAHYRQVTKNRCGLTNRYSFVHIESSQEQPGPLVTQSLKRIPAVPFAGQEVQATFRICNFGQQSFDTDQLYVQTTAPGINFPTVDPPALAPGGNDCYDYSQTTAAFPSGGEYYIRAGYMSNGTFQTLGTVTDAINEQKVYIVSPDMIQLQGEMNVTPDVIYQGETATIDFTVKNTSAVSVTDRFRVVIYNEDLSSEIVIFPESGDIALGSGDTWTYNANQVMDTPGIYWMVGEHYIGDSWQPVYGESQKAVRVMYPMPSKPTLAKGMPPYINLLGEPVNPRTGNFVHEHTDRVYPLPGISFDITRYFNSLDADEAIGQFGNGYTWSWGWHVEWRADKTAVLTYPDGRATYLVGELDMDDPFDLSGEYVGEFAETQTLVLAEDGTAVLEGNDQLRYEFDVEGRLAHVRDGSENGLDIIWDTSGHIEKVVHTSGAVFLFDYTGDYITAVHFPDGEQLTYTYSADGDLLTATNAADETMSYTYNDQNRMLTIENAKGQRILLNKYDDENRVVEQTDVDGVVSYFEYIEEETTEFYDQSGVKHTYDDEFRLIRVENARGAVITYDYDEDFNRIEKVDAEGGVWHWDYDDHARVISATNPVNATWLYTYDEHGNLTEEKDPLGRITKYFYDEHNNLIRKIDPKGGETVREYNAQGLVTRKIDSVGAVTTYTYNTMGLATSITDIAGISTMEYDEDGNRIRFTDAEGRTTTSTFDTEGRTLTTTGPLGNVITFTYDDNGNLLSETDGAGNTRTFTYSDADWLISYTDWDSNVWTSEYDVLGQLVREENPLGDATLYTYDEVGNVVAKRDQRGSLWRYEYDLNNRLTTATDPLGNETRYSYDAAGQRIAINRPCQSCNGGRAAETFTYDLAGQKIAYTDGRGFATQYKYDQAGRLVKFVDALGNSTYFAYNARGDKIEEIDVYGNSILFEYNAVGWLVAKTDRLGNQTTYTYDKVGNLKTVTNPRGFTITNTYNVADRLVQIENALGNVTNFEYDSRGNLTKVIDVLGRETTYTYDANNNLLSFTNPRSYTTQYEYDVLNREIKRTNALGGIQLITYDPMGAVLSQTDEAGYTQTFTYDLMGWVLTATDSNGHTTTFELDAYGNITKMIDASGAVTASTYDANGNLLTLTNALGHTTTYEYDALNREVKVIDALDGISALGYDALGRVVTETDANGNTTTHEYNAEGWRIATTDALGQMARFEYDQNGNLIRRIDRNGNVTLSEYDALDRPVKLTNGLGDVSTTSYDAVGNRVEIVNFRGYGTRYEYDANNNLVKVIDALNGETINVYDELDRSVAVTNANGHTTTTTYDAVSNILAVTLPEGQTTTATYDGEHNQLTFANAKGYVTQYTYDELNRLMTETNPLDYVTVNEYDVIGQVIGEIDAEGNVNSLVYDPLGRLIRVTDALGYVTSYSYDPVGNLLREVDANGHVTNYQYDALNRLTREMNPLDANWLYFYDHEGNMVQQTDANGLDTLYVFDAEDQIVEIDYSDDTGDVSMVYDPNGNLVQMDDGLGTTKMTYDSLDRLIIKTDLYGRIVNNEYDAVGNRVSLTYPSGNSVTFVYNANNWMTSMTDPKGGAASYQYDADGLPTKTIFSNDTWMEQEYDIAGRLVKLHNGTTYFQNGIITSYAYTLDKVGNRLQVVEQYTQGQVRTNIKNYAYNARYELLSAAEQYEGPPSYSVTTTYTYDPVGNRLSTSTDRDEMSFNRRIYVYDSVIKRFINRSHAAVLSNKLYTYDEANHMLTAGDIVYTYDANGNRISKLTPGKNASQTEIETYQYDAENRLTLYERARTQSGQVEQRVYSEYDGLGHRSSKGNQNASGVVKWVQYTLDGLGFDQLVEYPQTGHPIVTELYRGMNNALVSMDEIQGGGQGSQYWFATDGLNSVAATTKQNGQSTHEVFYDPYGQVIDENGHWEDSSSWTNPHLHYLLSGKEWDEESRLYYFGARYYDADAGVWITQDPYRGNINTPMTRHRSLYVRNNPINRIDPLGYFDFSTGAVEWGDTWQSIAAQWGTSVDELKRLNSYINEPRVGDYLYLPECRSAECQLQLGITQVRIGGLSGTECGQRIVQRQKAYKEWLDKQKRPAAPSNSESDNSDFDKPTKKALLLYSKDTISFYASANTDKWELDDKYGEGNVLMNEVVSDEDLMARILHYKKGELQELRIYTHSWDGGLQLVSGEDTDYAQVTINDFDDYGDVISSRFSSDAEVRIYGCRTGNSFAPKLANTLDVTVWGSTTSMKFYKLQEKQQNKFWFDGWKNVPIGEESSDLFRWAEFHGHSYNETQVKMFPYDNRLFGDNRNPDNYIEFEPN